MTTPQYTPDMTVDASLVEDICKRYINYCDKHGICLDDLRKVAQEGFEHAKAYYPEMCWHVPFQTYATYHINHYIMFLVHTHRNIENVDE